MEAKHANKQAYLDKMAAKLKEWTTEIEDLKTKADAGKSEAKIAYFKELERLLTRQEAAEEKLQELEEADDGVDEQAWEDIKTGVEKTWAEMKYTLDIAKSNLNKTL